MVLMIHTGFILRLTENQKVDHKIACSALNRMTALGMPDSVKV